VNKKKRDALIMQYAPLVKNIVERIAAKVPPHIAGREDLMNVGVIGLISAIEKFDKERNVQFETYARYRIRGAVLDELRSRDWLSRSTRNKSAKLEEAFHHLQKEFGRPPEDEEVAGFLGVTLEEYFDLLDDAKGVSILSSEDLPPEYCERYGCHEGINGTVQENPHSELLRSELRNILKTAVDDLPDKERLVLSLYYYEEMTMKEIGRAMSLTESRVCQLHSKAVLRLRGRLKDMRD
jgi:RNA polymerase sigma factor for flagellar operon FliA